jgi:hypothetical protein
MKTGDLVINPNEKTWGVGVVKEVPAGKVVALFERAGRKMLLRQFVEGATRNLVASDSPLLDERRWSELWRPGSKKDAREMTASDLFCAVRDIATETGEPIVWGEPFIDRWLRDRHLKAGQRKDDPDVTRNGEHWERADQEACAKKWLQKWRRENRRVGWSVPDLSTEAESLAIESGLQRVDRERDKWIYRRWDRETSAWR